MWRKAGIRVGGFVATIVVCAGLAFGVLALAHIGHGSVTSGNRPPLAVGGMPPSAQNPYGTSGASRIRDIGTGPATPPPLGVKLVSDSTGVAAHVEGRPGQKVTLTLSNGSGKSPKIKFALPQIGYAANVLVHGGGCAFPHLVATVTALGGQTVSSSFDEPQCGG